MFLRYCEREFDLDKIDMDKFQMNGKIFLADSRIIKIRMALLDEV